MYGYFVFEVQPPDDPVRTVVIFCGTSNVLAGGVISAVKKHAEDKLSPERIIILGLESERARIEEIARNDQLLVMLPQHTRHVNPPPIHVGTIPRFGLNDADEIGDLSWKSIREAGLTSVFRRRNALLVAPSTHHFEKPSKRHCDRFIRTANALVDGAEITFIAACCIRFIPASVQHFYCDTGGISVLAFAIDSLRRRFDPQAIPATVNTFESYEGLKKFVFHDCDDSIVLISASTSGGLEADVCNREKRFRPGQLITIFSVGTRENGTHVLLDVSKREEIRESLGELRSYDNEGCPLCARGSISVPMTGDQFIPAKTETKQVLLARKDTPPWLHRVLESMAGRHMLRAFYRSPNSDHATNDVFIDLERAFSGDWNSAFLKRLDRFISQNVPAQVVRIIHLDDAASTVLADRIKQRLQEDGSHAALEVVAASAAAACASRENGACLVIAAAVASGQSLLSISQTLRSQQLNNAITYIIALTRGDIAANVQKIETDVRMHEFANDFGFAAAERIYLPVVGRFAECSWNEELKIIKEWANTEEGDLQTSLEARIKLLGDAQGPTVRGLSDKLFWPNAAETPLELRRNFAFFSKATPTDVSQGDVYFTIVAILHFLRTNGPRPELRQTEYERRVLSPLCFDRFNDGVIQASLLRGAVRPELDFSDSPNESALMLSVLQSILRVPDTPKGEASREFVLALALGKLVLSKPDMLTLFKEFGESSGDLLLRRMWQHVGTACIGVETNA